MGEVGLFICGDVESTRGRERKDVFGSRRNEWEGVKLAMTQLD